MPWDCRQRWQLCWPRELPVEVIGPSCGEGREAVEAMTQEEEAGLEGVRSHRMGDVAVILEGRNVRDSPITTKNRPARTSH